MICKNCNTLMKETSRGDEDGMLTTIHECPKCNWSVKRWIDLDDLMVSHESWINDEDESQD